MEQRLCYCIDNNTAPFSPLTHTIQSMQYHLTSLNIHFNIIQGLGWCSHYCD